MTARKQNTLADALVGGSDMSAPAQGEPVGGQPLLPTTRELFRVA
jgi:hypothetical protein